MEFEDKTNSPDYEGREYKEQLPALAIVRDLSEGTLKLRERGTLYLPKEPREEDQHYLYRLSRAILYNAFSRAHSALVGMVFDSDPVLGEDVPEIMRGVEATETTPAREGQLENCDLAGTHIAVFMKETFDAAMLDGHSFVYVDMPPALPPGSTAEDEQRANRRPYLVRYAKDQAINWRTDKRGRLTQITFKECSDEPDGLFGMQKVERYRVLRPGSWELYKKVKVNGKDAIIPDPDAPGGTTSLSEIPVSICYARKTGILESKPPLLDMALVNVAHFQKYNDYSIYLHICSRPWPLFIGRDTTKNVETVGAYTFFDVPIGGDGKFMETSGSALGAARTDLLDLQEQMSVLALSLLQKKTVTKTATEEKGDQRKEESDLATAARSCQDCFEQAFKFWAQYLDPTATSGGSVTVGSVDDYEIDSQMMTALTASAGVTFSVATIRQMQAKGLTHLLPEGYSEEAEAAALEKEAKAKRDAMPDVGASLGRMFNAGAVE